MYILKNNKDCCGCHACYNACPVNAINMLSDSEGFLYPKINEEKCVKCNKCRIVCPILNKPKLQPLKEIYGCKASLFEERLSSTSGGVFAVIARSVLAENGLICGAVFDENQDVFHLVSSDETGLLRMKGTKYLQSIIGDTYKEIKAYLESGKQVLFSGTPCQVAGLKSYLGKDYDNLLSLDLICHGVPSPKVWQRYLKEIAEGNKIDKVVFRNKHMENNIKTIDYYFSNGKVKTEDYSESLYILGFIKNLYLRPSCFNCQFKGIKRCSDITIGDFWGIKEHHSDFSDNYGVSTVIIHNNKGKSCIEKISNKLEMIVAKEKEISCWNECLLVPARYTSNRDLFFEKWNDESIMDLIREIAIDAQNKQLKSDKNIILRIVKKIMNIKNLLLI